MPPRPCLPKGKPNRISGFGDPALTRSFLSKLGTARQATPFGKIFSDRPATGAVSIAVVPQDG
ncbi:unnamed protein product [Tuwongella immobilis]|uniref:Uncharacterized protein n=1 Tax=Tuwongella immobilis TaxID=692036 RepID=A0A6C2YPW5_9BACT|nr:unnamed protein product [Tuwongella immobilis]VTS04708.1 unnamed protein product [Tuwongella immobilis]